MSAEGRAAEAGAPARTSATACTCALLQGSRPAFGAAACSAIRPTARRACAANGTTTRARPAAGLLRSVGERRSPGARRAHGTARLRAGTLRRGSLRRCGGNQLRRGRADGRSPARFGTRPGGSAEACARSPACAAAGAPASSGCAKDRARRCARPAACTQTGSATAGICYRRARQGCPKGLPGRRSGRLDGDSGGCLRGLWRRNHGQHLPHAGGGGGRGPW